MQGHLSETELLGFELGGEGLVSVLAYAITAVRDLFSNMDKMDRIIEQNLTVYKVQELSDDKLVLRLKQLDY